jgi:hypothetical protein
MLRALEFAVLHLLLLFCVFPLFSFFFLSLRFCNYVFSLLVLCQAAPIL